MDGLGCCCVVSVAFPVFLIVWAGAGGRFKGRRFGLYMAASVPAFVVFVILAFNALEFYASRPYHVYHSSFGIEPTPDVEIVNSSWHDLLSGCTRHIKFYADQATIDGIVAQGMKRDENAPLYPRDDPRWWRPRIAPGKQAYVGDTCESGSRQLRHKEPEFGSEREILIYDPSTREAYYRYTGIN
jgi:hypothetical protein